MRWRSRPKENWSRPWGWVVRLVVTRTKSAPELVSRRYRAAFRTEQDAASRSARPPGVDQASPRCDQGYLLADNNAPNRGKKEIGKWQIHRKNTLVAASFSPGGRRLPPRSWRGILWTCPRITRSYSALAVPKLARRVTAKFTGAPRRRLGAVPCPRPRFRIAAWQR
jgi:hypothetical protein